MIINLRGTSGSGKTTLVRAITKQYQQSKERYTPGRRQPLATLYTREEGRPLFVPGHYNSPCGGCDTIHTMEKVFQLVKQADTRGWDVLFEGLLISADSKRTMELANEGRPLTVIGLDLPLDVCLDSVNQRRRRKKPDAPDVNPKNTESKWKGVRSSIRKMLEAGIDCEWHDRSTGQARIEQLLHLGESHVD